jgi:hypothetical protein
MCFSEHPGTAADQRIPSVAATNHERRSLPVMSGWFPSNAAVSGSRRGACKRALSQWILRWHQRCHRRRSMRLTAPEGAATFASF